VVTSTDILTFFRTQSFERLARLVITISADDAKMFTFLDLGIFVAVGNVLILKVKILSSLQSRLLFYPNSVTKHEYGR
jgi:hypothetical protein